MTVAFLTLLDHHIEELRKDNMNFVTGLVLALAICNVRTASVGNWTNNAKDGYINDIHLNRNGWVFTRRLFLPYSQIHGWNVWTFLTSKINMEQHVLERRSLEIATEESHGNKLSHNCRAMQMQKGYLYWMPAACVVVAQINPVCTFKTCFSSVSSWMI